MIFSNNNMLFLHVFVAVLAVGDCSLTPILTPLMALFGGNKGTTAPNIRPSPTSYRIQSSLPPPIPSSVSMTSDNRWGSMNLGNPAPETAVPNVIPLGNGMENRPIAQVQPTPVASNVDNDMYKYMIEPHRYHVSGRWFGGERNRNPNIMVTPLQRVGLTDMNRSWKIDDRSGEETEKNTIVVKPWKYGGIRNINNKVMIYGTSGEGNGWMQNHRYAELGSNEVSVKPLKRGMNTNIKRQWLINGDTREDREWINSRSDEHSSVERPDAGNMYWRSRWINGGEDPGHDTDDQPDHDRQERMKIRIKTKNPDDPNEKMRRIVIITKSARPRSSWYRAYLRSRDASRKRIHRHGLLTPQPLMARSGNNPYDCVNCNA